MFGIPLMPLRSRRCVKPHRNLYAAGLFHLSSQHFPTRTTSVGKRTVASRTLRITAW